MFSLRERAGRLDAGLFPWSAREGANETDYSGSGRSAMAALKAALSVSSAGSRVRGRLVLHLQRSGLPGDGGVEGDAERAVEFGVELFDCALGNVYLAERVGVVAGVAQKFEFRIEPGAVVT